MTQDVEGRVVQGGGAGGHRIARQPQREPVHVRIHGRGQDAGIGGQPGQH